MMSFGIKNVVAGLLVAGAAFAVTSTAEATAIVPSAFNSNTLPGNDDGFTGLVPIGFNINFYALVGTTQLYVNNNGNVTFNAPLGTFTPFPIVLNGVPMLAPFFGDVDTRGASAQVTYGTGTFDGHDAFGVNWVNVGYYNTSPSTNRNSFQLIIVDRPDTGADGNFDFMFNYDQIQWETGQASGSDFRGCGGTSARAGWTDGTTHSTELTGSGINGALIDSGNCNLSEPVGASPLINSSIGSNVLGRYVFQVREGNVVVDDNPAVPEPATVLMLGTGLMVVGGLVRRRRR